MPASLRFSPYKGIKPPKSSTLSGFALSAFVGFTVPMYAYKPEKAEFSSISQSLFSVCRVHSFLHL